LKGLPEPERLWQIIAPGLQLDFPPLQSLTEIPSNLPLQLTSFIGREKEVEQIKKRLETNRLVTLTGSGGIGKTRLSIQVAAELLDEYPHGVWLVELAPITDPGFVTQTVCTALGVTPQGKILALDVLTEYLKSKRILLVVDNCEHLIDACAHLCDSILHICPQVHILASSREALGIDGENSFRVPSLSLPDPNGGLQTVEESEAVKLFMERAHAVLPEFELTEVNTPFVAQICQRLDGIALAIELAASRVKLLKVEQIASRLDDAFRLLTGGSRTALPRQQTLRALIDWSYNLLSDEEKTLLRHLSVFVGGWTLDAAEAVCDNSNIFDLLTHLADKSLIAVDLEHGDEPRYYLLETIRQYAREKLAESGEGEFVRERHANWFVELAERAEPKLRATDQFHWLDRIDQDHNNFRSALEWSLDHNIEAGLRIGISLVWFWDAHDHCVEAVHYMERLLAAEPNVSSIIRANAFARSSYLAALAYDLTNSPEYLEQINKFTQSGLKMSRQLHYLEGEAFSQLAAALGFLFRGDIEPGLSLAEHCLVLFEEAGTQWGMCRSYTAIAFFRHAQGDYEKTTAAYKSALVLSRQTGDLNMATFLLFSLGRIALEQGQIERAQPLFEESLILARRAKNKHLISGNLQSLGSLYIGFKEYGQAREWLAECVAIQKDTGDQAVLFSLNRLGRVAYLQGDYKESANFYADGLHLSQKVNSLQTTTWCLLGFAGLAASNNQLKTAAQLLGVIESIPEFTIISAPGDRYWMAQISNELVQIKDIIRAQLDETIFQTQYELGQQMSLDETVAYALKELS
jgi:predicted ATPase